MTWVPDRPRDPSVSKNVPGKRLVLVGEFNAQLARRIAHAARPARAPSPGMRWVLREWTETHEEELVAYAQWVELADEPSP
jgi:hypothetical protein